MPATNEEMFMWPGSPRMNILCPNCGEAQIMRVPYVWVSTQGVQESHANIHCLGCGFKFLELKRKHDGRVS